MQNIGPRKGVMASINWSMRPLESFVGEMKKSLKLWARDALLCVKLL